MRKSKRIIASLIASALIASAALPAVVYAENKMAVLLTDSPISYAIAGGQNGEWEITSDGIDVFAGKTFDYISDCKLHIGLSKDYNDSMTLGFRFVCGEKTYEINYIMMKAEKHMDIPITDIVNALNDQYPDETIPYDKFESGVITDSAGLIDEMYVTGTFDTPTLADTVWEVKGEDDTIVAYWVFYSDGKGGNTLDALTGIGLPFAYEQNGKDIVFHFGSADDNTPGKFEINEDGIFLTVNYGENGENTAVSQVYLRMGEDADTFDPDEYTDNTAGDFERITYTELMLPDAASVLADANGTAGGNVGLRIEFGEMLKNGYDLDFVFQTSDGTVKKVNASRSKSLKKNIVFVKVRDLLNEAGVAADDVTDFRVLNNGDKTIDKITVGMGSEDASEIRFESAAAPVTEPETNPGTGVGIASSAILAAGAAVLGLVSRKRR